MVFVCDLQGPIVVKADLLRDHVEPQSRNGAHNCSRFASDKPFSYKPEIILGC